MAPAPLALAVLGRGVVDPATPLLRADDEAVLRGRAAFETLRVYAGVPFRVDLHLRRLAESARVLELPPPDTAALAELVAEALGSLGRPDAVMRVVWTPGSGDGGSIGFVLVTPVPAGFDEMRARGIALASLQLAIGAATRSRSPWLLPGVKSTSYAVNMAAQAEARRRGADDALFLSLEDIALECPTSNVWFVEGGVLHTPALDLGILAGVTRETLLAAARDAGIHVEEGEYPRDRLAAAGEAFTSSSVREVMPVVRLDGAQVGDGRPGPVAAQMQAALRAAVAPPGPGAGR
ncbi:MAG TPA: aminotransferase class IV [Gaiellales bacterium]|nr:aminotransferase class IV [Gaiellales bacterium]